MGDRAAPWPGADDSVGASTRARIEMEQGIRTADLERERAIREAEIAQAQALALAEQQRQIARI